MIPSLPQELWERIALITDQPHQVIGRIAQLSRAHRAYVESRWSDAFRRRFHGLAPLDTDVRTEYRSMLDAIRGIEPSTSVESLAQSIFRRKFAQVRIFVAAGVDLQALDAAMVAVLQTRPLPDALVLADSLFFPEHLRDLDDRLGAEVVAIRRLLLPCLPSNFSVQYRTDLEPPDDDDEPGNAPYYQSISPLATAALHSADADRALFWQIYRQYDGDATASVIDNRFASLPFVHAAAWAGNMPLLRELLEHHRGDRRVITHLRNENGCTPLYHATEEAAALLVAAGADLNAEDDDGDSPLAFNLTISSRTEGHLLLLVGGERSVNRIGLDGSPVLSLAVEAGHVRLVARIVEAGADPTLPNDDGFTPLEVAEQQRGRLPRATVDRMVALLKATSEATSPSLEKRARH